MMITMAVTMLTMAVQVWMTISLACREGPRPCKVEVLPTSTSATSTTTTCARLTFRSTEAARRFRRLHAGPFLAGRIEGPPAAASIPEIASRNILGGTSRKSRSANEPPKTASKAPKLMGIARKAAAPPAPAPPSPPEVAPKPAISVKNDVFLKGPTQSDLKLVLETVQKTAKALEIKPDKEKLEKELTPKPREGCAVPWEAVVVEVAEEGGRVARVRVLRVAHNKVQDFFHHDPLVLVRAVIRWAIHPLLFLGIYT